MKKFAVLFASATAVVATAGHAAGWSPDSAVTLVVPFAAGGPTDALSRRLAEALSPALGQPVIVENRPGAGGNIGAQEVARAQPDGLTVLFATTGQMAINVSLYGSVEYDPRESFEPVVLIGDLPNVLTVHPSVPATNLGDFLDFAASSPDALRYASSGNGATSHLAGVRFAQQTEVPLDHIPYGGTGPALTDLLGGHVEITFTDVLTAKPHIDDGRLNAIGVTTLERSAALPDIPTLDEQGLADFDISVAFALLVPADTPPEIVATLNEVANEALDRQEIKQFLDQQGIRAAEDRTPQGLADFIEESLPRWKEIVEASGARID